VRRFITTIGLLAAIAACPPPPAFAQAGQRGHLDLHGIDLNEPALIALVRPLLPPRDSSGADRTVTLDRLHLDFERSADKLVVANGAACHHLFAATIDGYADLASGDLHFGGVLWPAYPAAMLDHLMPILGILPSQPSHSGLVGLSYKVAGTREAPRLLINPFADVYPGPLRYITKTCWRPDAGGG
jgi:hypothetical protein